METQEEKPASQNETPINEISVPAGGETNPGRRPNAKYRLSREKANEDELVFYYNRERRLAKAPQPVRDLYKDEPPRKFNLLRPLVGSKPRAMMFGTIVIMCLTLLILSFFGYTGSDYSLAGNSLSVQAKKYGGVTTFELKKIIKKSFLFSANAPYTGAVDMAIFPAMPPNGADSQAGRAGEPPPVFYHRLFFSLEPNEVYSFSVPFDTDDLVMVLQTEKNILNIKVKAKE